MKAMIIRNRGIEGWTDGRIEEDEKMRR